MTYSQKPERFLERLQLGAPPGADRAYCAGFELSKWRCKPFASHLVEWLPDYALTESELNVHHGNAYAKLKQAAVRVYTSSKYSSRGEAGEIALHAICRDFFGTIPISPRVFYKSTSNDVIKAFDLIHARFLAGPNFEIWLGESKLYTNSSQAISSAIKSIRDHIDLGFLTNQKLLLGPQIPKDTPHYEKIIEVFKMQSSIDKFLERSVFVIGILCNSDAVANAKTATVAYATDVKLELDALVKSINASGLKSSIKLFLLYVPLGSKQRLVTEFDRCLKGLQ